LKRGGNTTQTVYFDAFKHDFIDEPLISLMGVIEDRFNEVNDKTWGTRFAPVVGFAKKLIKPAARIAAAVGTGMASEAAIAAIGTTEIDTMADGAIDATFKATGVEASASVDDLWKSEAGRRQAMVEFRKSLIDLTKIVQVTPADAHEDEAEKTATPEPRHRKLVIVVDELDRCRPDYALSLLEIIKHFFDVPHVHFVLGVNMSELENSVKARYGAGINAGLYLQKFVTVTMGLPDTSTKYRGRLHAIDFYCRHDGVTGLSSDQRNIVQILLEMIVEKDTITLRAVQRLLSILKLSTIPSGCSDDDQNEEMVVASMALMKVLSPKIYKTISSKPFTMEDVEALFAVDPNSQGKYETRMFDAWQYYLDPKANFERRETGNASPPKPEERLETLNTLRRKHLEVFALNDAG
jgi:hypothetical protein